jgi:hypothetical protein
VKPREEPFDLSAPTRPTEGTAILCGRRPPLVPRQSRCALRHQTLVERVAAVTVIAIQARREASEEAGVEGRGDECGSYGEALAEGGDRKTMAVADRHDLAPLHCK